MEVPEWRELFGTLHHEEVSLAEKKAKPMSFTESCMKVDQRPVPIQPDFPWRGALVSVSSQSYAPQFSMLPIAATTVLTRTKQLWTGSRPAIKTTPSAHQHQTNEVRGWFL